WGQSDGEVLPAPAVGVIVVSAATIARAVTTERAVTTRTTRGYVRSGPVGSRSATEGLHMSYIQIEKPRPKVTLVTLNRPERMNAMAFDVMVPLRDALHEISFDNECRVVVITGAGHGFCSGADLEGTGVVPHITGLKRTSIARRAMKVLDDVILAIRDMHQPVIAAVNGAAIGGGFCLASACDLRIASDTAYFRAAGINNGLT